MWLELAHTQGFNRVPSPFIQLFLKSKFRIFSQNGVSIARSTNECFVFISSEFINRFYESSVDPFFQEERSDSKEER